MTSGFPKQAPSFWSDTQTRRIDELCEDTVAKHQEPSLTPVSTPRQRLLTNVLEHGLTQLTEIRVSGKEFSTYVRIFIK